MREPQALKRMSAAALILADATWRRITSRLDPT